MDYFHIYATLNGTNDEILAMTQCMYNRLSTPTHINRQQCSLETPDDIAPYIINGSVEIWWYDCGTVDWTTWMFSAEQSLDYDDGFWRKLITAAGNGQFELEGIFDNDRGDSVEVYNAHNVNDTVEIHSEYDDSNDDFRRYIESIISFDEFLAHAWRFGTLGEYDDSHKGYTLTLNDVAEEAGELIDLIYDEYGSLFPLDIEDDDYPDSLQGETIYLTSDNYSVLLLPLMRYWLSEWYANNLDDVEAFCNIRILEYVKNHGHLAVLKNEMPE